MKAPISRDITCWYCRRGRHTDCFSKRVCACRVCLEIHDPKPDEGGEA